MICKQSPARLSLCAAAVLSLFNGAQAQTADAPATIERVQVTGSSIKRLAGETALPVSTPPNAIVYGSGLIKTRRMIGAGIGMDVLSGTAIWIVLRVAGGMDWNPFLQG